ncbi:MAG: tetratricopeptide repeat protein, partial [Deltaproteobacteria bacterium]|nr:tetratricopeptide repeat protein [Deltaproteobacteria bacterium]MBW2327539.1 tetratricopeptide repeat protein [Deltaproteobacteria bacterium]
MVLLVLASWLLVHNWQHRTIFYKDYAFEARELDTFRHFPRALYALGRDAWFNNDAPAAARFFRQAVRGNIFYMDAWLELAQAETVLERPDQARSILKFSDGLTRNVYRWKWDQILLANELGMEEIVFHNINFLVKHGKKLQDAFQVLDTLLDGNAVRSVEVLEPENLMFFLEWLMRWGRVDPAEFVWDKITETGIRDEDVRSKYVHFLVNKKQVLRAAEISRAGGGLEEGLSNPGFEDEISSRGFDWRYTANNKGKWTIRRTLFGAVSGTHCLKIMFEGKENISFGHLYQIVPVNPMADYRLTYSWRSRDLTTDQGPFVDIYGYDCTGFYRNGPMMLGTQTWREQKIEFTVPEDCHAVVVRLHRRTSRRFDSKIGGTLWLDSFNLEKITVDERKQN